MQQQEVGNVHSSQRKDDNLVSVSTKLNKSSIECTQRLFEVNVVLAGLGTQTDFLELRLMLLVALLAQTFFLLVLEFSEVHDAADRWTIVWTDLNQIHSGFLCQFQTVSSGNDPCHVSILVDDPDGRNPNLLVDPLRFVDFSVLS